MFSDRASLLLSHRVTQATEQFSKYGSKNNQTVQSQKLAELFYVFITALEFFDLSILDCHLPTDDSAHFMPCYPKMVSARMNEYS